MNRVSAPQQARPGPCRCSCQAASAPEIRGTLLNFRPRLLGYCASPERRPKPKGVPAMSMYIGEALVGDGNEVAHIDLMIGSKTGPVGVAFANALSDQKQGFTNLLAVLTANLICKTATVLPIKCSPEAG